MYPLYQFKSSQQKMESRMNKFHGAKGPVSLQERFVSLDLLRGLAVMGILIMNIQSYSMISAAYINPTAYGDFTGQNKWVWILSHMFADQKFMTIFSILFGAGVLLFTERLTSKGYTSLGLHYRRTFWLFIIGIAHAYLFWYGDILVSYAMCAVVVVLFRKLSPKTLVSVGFSLIVIPSLLYLMFGFSWDFIPPEGQEGIKNGWYSTPELIAKEIAAYKSGWFGQMSLRIKEAVGFQTFIFLIYSGWRCAGMMLIGMALYKWGILLAKKSYLFFQINFTIGLLVGLPVIIFGLIGNFANDWAVHYSMFLGWQYNYWGSIFVAWAYISLAMLIYKWLQNTILVKALSAVGRTALTNYLLQTIICTFIFYGHGLGYYGSVERSWQILIVLIIWIFQLVISPLWLAKFYFGPAEWLWRSLTYWKVQPILVKSKK
jgi:uncharacterized protein